MMKSPVWMMFSGAAALVIGAGLYFLAMMEADLRFAACNGYFRLDAAESYCRSVGHIAIAGIGLGASGLTLIGVSSVVAWARRVRPQRSAPMLGRLRRGMTFIPTT